MNFVTFPECFLLIIEVRVLYRLSTAPNWLWLPGFLAWTKFLDSVLQINDKMCPKILHGRNWSVKLNNPGTPTQKLLSSLSHITVSLKLPKKHPGPDNCHSKLCQKIVTYFVKNLSWLRLRRGWPSDAIFNVWTINAEKPCVLYFRTRLICRIFILSRALAAWFDYISSRRRNCNFRVG